MLAERAPRLQVVPRDDGGERRQRGVLPAVRRVGGAGAGQIRTLMNAERCRSRR